MKYFKSNTLLNQPTLNVDRENGVIRSVSIVEKGANKNGTYFGEKYLKDLAKGANEQKQGVKCRFGHPNMCATTLGTYLGRYKNFKFDDGRVTADLTLDPISKKTQVEGKGISMFEYVMDMAENNPDMFGNSIHIPSPIFEDDPVEVEGRMYDSHVYNGIVASDLVESPAATSGLFGADIDLGLTVTDFLDENPEIFGALEKDPEILFDFLNRYNNYINLKQGNKMSKKSNWLEKLTNKLKGTQTFNIDVTLANGDIVTVITEADKPAKGDSVTDSEGVALKDGEYTKADGGSIVVKAGTIEEIKEPANPDPEEPTNAKVMQSVNSLTEKLDKFNTLASDNQKAIELIAEEMGSFKEQLNTLAKSVGSKTFDVPPGEDTDEDPEEKLSAYDRALAQRAAMAEEEEK